MAKNPGDTHLKRHVKNRGRGSGNKELIIPDENDGEELAIVISSLGHYRFKVKLVESGIEHNAKMRGNLIKGPNKQVLRANDLVLLTRDISYTAEDKFYILHKYTESFKKDLIKLNLYQENDNNQINLDETNDDLFDRDNNEEIDLSKI